MNSIERFLLALDAPPWGAIARILLGLAILPAFRALSGGSDAAWITVIVFVGLLMALRIGPAVLRRVLPFSEKVRNLWFERRNMAKLYDSYQWQKLFWIGLGMLPCAFIGGGLGNGERAIVLFCLIGGAAGLLFWRRQSASQR